MSLALSTGAGPSQTLYWYKPECCLLKFTTVSPTRKPKHKRTISSSSPFLLPETGPLGFNRQKLLEPSKQKPGLGGSYGNMFQMDAGLLGVQRLGLHQGLSCTLEMGRGGHCPRQEMGGTSVSLQVTRVGEGLRGAKGQALPSLVTLPGGREETEIIRVFSWKSAFIRNQRPRILHHLNGLRSEN